MCPSWTQRMRRLKQPQQQWMNKSKKASVWNAKTRLQILFAFNAMSLFAKFATVTSYRLVTGKL